MKPRSTKRPLWLAAGLSAMALSLVARPSHADDHASRTLAISPGVALGAAHGDAVVGGEVSVVHAYSYFVPLSWYGGYADAIVDAAAHRVRFSLGPEAGLGPLGVDGGFVLTSRGEPGACARVLVGIPLFMGYARGIVVDDARGRFSGEVGVLVKSPIPVRHRP